MNIEISNGQGRNSVPGIRLKLGLKAAYRIRLPFVRRSVPHAEQHRAAITVNDVPGSLVHRRVSDMHNILTEVITHENGDATPVWASNSTVEARDARVSREGEFLRLPRQPGLSHCHYRRLLDLL